MTTYPKLLSPIAQRLLLYRFALLEIQPGVEAPLGRWGLPYLQKLRDRGAWSQVLAQAFPFNLLGESPVISPSIAYLQRIRHHQPWRPLVLCRPLYAAPIRPDRLRPLVQPNLLIARTLASDDALRPLRWSAPIPNRPQCQLATWSDQHPMTRLHLQMCRLNPGSSFSFREDGRLLEQLNLFEQAHPIALTPQLQDELSMLEQQILLGLAARQGFHLVFAKERTRLEWFQRDCRRWLPIRYQCRPYPSLPDPRDPLPYFILVHDASIRMRALPADLNCLHLDGGTSDLRYRAARMGLGTPNWLVGTEPTRTARLTTDYGILRFVLEQGQWYSYRGEPEQHEQAVPAFQHHLAKQAILYQRSLPSLLLPDRSRASP